MSWRQGGATGGDIKEVYFDLEATGLEQPHITQFSAIGPGDTEVFTRYVKPGKPIGRQASDLTGLTFTGGVLYLKGKRVESVSLKECIQEFIDYLDGRKVYLVAHYAHGFDAPLLLWSARSCDLLQELRENVLGFIDTLPMFRAMYPQLKGTQQAPYGQRALTERLLHENQASEQHDSMEDARALRRLVKYAAPSSAKKLRYNRSVQYVLNYTKTYT